MYLGVTPCKSPKISTIWEFRNSDDNFKKPFTSIYPNVCTFRLGGHCKKRFTSVDLNIYKFLVPFSIVYIGVIEIQPYGDSHLDKSKKPRVLGFLFSECNFQKPFTSIYRKMDTCLRAFSRIPSKSKNSIISGFHFLRVISKNPY